MNSDKDPGRPPVDDTARRALAALQKSARRARLVAAQTGTRLITVRDGEIVAEPVSPAEIPALLDPDRPAPPPPTP